ncbi:NADH-quinone oxidoreductase subunit C [Phenylobacterium montanum]|uniref:NADH-quinone oxidoreductase subunit C n=1 Tax=Phenylobacterium montanum TaxID=2823693 RepID=A0A975G0S3_9CAUL|nr:NADH-quinone oxidoreductase subunit C [Caulobacter sp. S6]QUD88494.1 NADH-quinone oxidoreductase subunit C [Caulobacter sp. S6]
MIYAVSDEDLTALGERAVADSAGAIGRFEVAYGELNLYAHANRIVEALTLLRDSPAFRFNQLIDLCGVDYPERAKRFDVVYHLLSLSKNRRVRVKIETDEDTPVATIIGVYPCAEWFEREAFDMYGVSFSNHPDLRRLLTDYGFQGYPLRKDFPMTGYVEVRYDDEQKRVVYEPVKIAEFRAFDFLSPWEGAQGTYVLPGDEKKGA